MEKTINICGHDVKFKATGQTVRLYRQIFQRDILADMTTLSDQHANGQTLTAEALMMFENIAYIMAKQGDPSIPDDPDEWLDQFDMFSIYTILPQLIELWGISTLSISNSKKKVKQPIVR